MSFNLPPKADKEKAPTQQTLESVYLNPELITLYRYENPSTEYDDSREDEVSKKHLVGNWFTDSTRELSAYIKMRQPGGRIVVIRVTPKQLAEFDATKNEETKNMDIEYGNYVVPGSVQTMSRLEIPLLTDTVNQRKFLFQDWKKVEEFVSQELTPAKLIERIAGK